VKRLLYYTVTCLIVATILAPIMDRHALTDFWRFAEGVAFGFAYSFSGLFLSIWTFRYLDRKFDWQKNIVKRLVIGVLVVEALSLFTYGLVTPLILFFLRGTPWDSVVSEMKSNFVMPLLMGLPGMLIIASIEFFRYWKASYLKQQRLRTEMMAYKYTALHNQLNPHFLFNSFNVLSSLLYESPDLAVSFLEQLTELYKRVLDRKDKELIHLSEELEFIQSYAFLLRTRFEDKLHINVNVSATNDDWIAPMVLQLLIENAVKHNVISKAEPLAITIERRGDVIETRNAIRRKRVGDDARGMGLVNIRQRYGFFTQRPVQVTEEEGNFIVRIPVLIKKQR
jgi:two-component system, LytTR family, sensor kinase